MQTVLFDKVRERAYALWKAEGMIEGRHLDHWFAAERELVVQGEAPPAPAKRKTKSRRATAPMA